MKMLELPRADRESRLLPGSRSAARLHVQRTGIRFHNLAPERVSIEIEVENRGGERSAPTILRLEAAPFGAFVRWSPLAHLRVPSIAAGGRVRLQTVARQPRPGPVGGFSGLRRPPVLSAAGFQPERARRPRPARPGLATALLGAVLTRGGTRPERGVLPPDLLDLLDGPRPHWAGNLNVWIGPEPVERHMAPRLRIHAGRANLAAFCVGERPDEYAFRLEGPGGGWKYALLDPCTAAPVAWTAEPGAQPHWHPVRGLQYLFAVLRPPEECGHGAVVVHVTQRSSARTAQVEFDLDPAAAGPGCYRI